jgi:hypothetical protein
MTEWVLVLITLTFHGHPEVQEVGRYDSMTECFMVREQLALDVGGDPATGHFPKGMQAVCIPHSNKYEK